MSADFFGINFTIPAYFHREYKNNAANQATVNDNQVLAFRVINTAIPFIGLYKPLNHTLSIGLGIYRSIICLSQLRTLTQSDTKENISSQLINTTTSIIALAATIIAPPLGMVITTVQDLIIEIGNLENHLSTGKHNQAIESCVNIINNALYLSLFFIGGIELTIASLALQIMLGIYHGRSELRKGNYIEASGHTLMAIFRCKQMADQVRLLQSRWKIENTFKKQLEVEIQNQKNDIEKNIEELEAIKRQQSKEIQKQKEVIEKIQEEIQAFKEQQSKESEAQVSKVQELEKKLLDQQELQQILITYGNNTDGLFPFHYAVKIGDTRAVELLLQNGADVNARCLNFTPLFLAVRANQVAIAMNLLDKGADVNIGIGSSNLTAITSASFLGNLDMVNLLIANGAFLNPTNTMTPLDVAAVHGHYKVAVALINNGANIQGMQGINGSSLTNGTSPIKWETTLDRAATNLKYSNNPQNLDLIKFLVDKGATRTNKNEVPCPVINGYLKSVGR